jgi:hypothetical protein
VEWGKLYANLPDDPRVQAAEDNGGAAWLLLESMCYCTRAERAGFIPHTQVDRFGGARLRQRVAALVRENLWLPVDGGYELNPDVWSEERNLSDSAEKKRQKDRDRIKAKRAAAKLAAEAAAEESRDTSRDNHATDDATCSGDSRALEKRREEKRSTAGLVGHLQEPDPRATAIDDGSINRIAQALAERAGQPITGQQAREVVAVVLARAAQSGTHVGHVTPYVLEAIKTETDVYDLLLASRMAEIAAATGAEFPEWCAKCDEQTRQIGRDGDSPARCPNCHPTNVRLA